MVSLQVLRKLLPILIYVFQESIRTGSFIPFLKSPEMAYVRSEMVWMKWLKTGVLKWLRDLDLEYLEIELTRFQVSPSLSLSTELLGVLGGLVPMTGKYQLGFFKNTFTSDFPRSPRTLMLSIDLYTTNLMFFSRKIP